MKRHSLLSLSVLIVCFMLVGGHIVLAEGTAKVTNQCWPCQPTIYINAEKQELKGNIPPSGSTLVPFRAFFSSLKLNAQFDNQTKTVTAKNDDTTITLTAGKRVATLYGKEVSLLQSPALSEDDDLMYVNLRFIAETFGAVVRFDKSTLSIYIDFPKTNQCPPRYANGTR
ncbi:copper amine oxidase N-terminal domain-containing protein [Paenibacillus sp. GCM10027629]|uniref:copper amine oxidase N-terminal domain-containing protein n=1 Tax=Paenibacillus sp. GCM10027629 TaxID=3273414 RepID=UPI003643D571